MGEHDQLIRDTFVDLADTLASDYDVGEFLQVLVQRCEDVLSVTTCGVLVEDPQGVLRLAAAASREMHQLEQAEIHLMDGPSLLRGLPTCRNHRLTRPARGAATVAAGHRPGTQDRVAGRLRLPAPPA